MLPADDLNVLAERLSYGLIAALVKPEEVYEGRRIARNFDNVMFTPVEPDASIPWRDAFFTLIYAPEHREPTTELLRVLTPDGTLLLASTAYSKVPR